MPALRAPGRMPLGAVLLAAGAAADNSALLDEVVVTASRRPAVVSDLALPVSVIDEAAVRRRALVVDAIDNAVGAYVQQTTPGQGAAIIRGQRGSSILHMIDGMRINNAIFRSAPTQYLALLPVTAVSRVEVVRGTPASLYGNDAIGGVVQVVTRRPAFASRHTALRGDIRADFDSADESRRFAATLDAGNSSWQGSFSGHVYRGGDRRTGGGARLKPSGYRAHAARAFFASEIEDYLTWSVDAQLYQQPHTPRIDELVPGFGVSQPASSEFAFAPNERRYVNITRRRSDGLYGLDWQLSLAWQRIDDDRITRGFGATTRRRERNRSDLYGLLVTAAGAAERADWLAGIEVYVDRVSSMRHREDLRTGSVVPVAARFPHGADQRQFAAFVQATRRLKPGTSLTAGLRAGSARVGLPASDAAPATAVRTTDIAGDLGFLADLGRGWQWLANVGFGFRAPNVFDLGTFGNRPGNRFNVPNASLDSERAVQIDAGLRYRGERLAFEFVTYALDYRDRIVSIGTGETTSGGRDIVRSVNAAEAETLGIEFGAELALGAALRLKTAVTLTRGSKRVADTREPADRVPPLGGYLALHWSGDERFAASVWLRGTAGQERLSARDRRDPRIDPNGTPGWGQLGGRVDYRGPGNWRFSLTADNLTDKRYRVHGSGIDAPGRRVALTIRRSFGGGARPGAIAGCRAPASRALRHRRARS